MHVSYSGLSIDHKQEAVAPLNILHVLNASAAHRRAEAKRKEIEARQFKERLAERQETLEEKRQKKAEEEAVSVLVFHRSLALVGCSQLN